MNKDYRQALIDALIVWKKREIANHAPFKARAYHTVIQQLQMMTEPVETMEQLAHLKGVGEKIREKMEEVFQKGQRIEETKERIQADELQAVYGIGPKKATELIEQGICSVADLRRLEPTELSNRLNDKQRVGLRYYEDLIQRIPREEMEEHERILLRHSTLSLELVGSYRRGLSTSGDIDVLLRVPEGQTPRDIQLSFYDYVQRLVYNQYIEKILAIGPHKCMAICRLSKSPKSPKSPSSPSSPIRPSRRLDLLVTPDAEYAYSLLYFTGSDRFNVAFRQHALTKGYSLNEHRLTPVQGQMLKPPYMKTEQDIFHFLGLEYTPPQERIDTVHIRKVIRPVANKGE